MAGSMKDIKLRIKSVESTMQITKAMELVASSKMRRAKERVEHSRPYFETLYESLTKIAAADPRARNPYLRRDDIKRTLLVVIAGDRGLAGGYNANVFKQADAAEGPVTVLPIGKRSAEYFAHHGAGLFTPEVLMAADVSVSECFTLSHQITEGFPRGAAPDHRAHRGPEGRGPSESDPVQTQLRGSVRRYHPRVCGRCPLRRRVRERGQ